MPSRLDLHEKLCEILGTKFVYYNPPETVRLQYPCIVYSKSKPSVIKANNKNYKMNNQYLLTVISSEPDCEIADTLVNNFDYCSIDRNFVSDNLYHDILTLYY